MQEIKIVYWSGTGNTKEMADLVAEGVTAAGGSATVLSVDEVSADVLKEDAVFAMGCPSMGAEVLEEDAMEPFVAEAEQFAAGKKIGLFGSYGWGDGEWMRDWEERMKNAGAVIVKDAGVILMEAPDEAGAAECKALGEALAAANV